MSFILDALRKVDQERGPSGDQAPVAASIEAFQQARARRRRQYGAMAAIAVVSAVATAAALRILPKAEVPATAEPPGTSALVVPVPEPTSTRAQGEPEANPEPIEPRPSPPPVRARRQAPKTVSPEPEQTGSPEPEPPPAVRETVPLEVAETEPATVGAIRVVGEASPTRSITHSPAEIPEATDPAELPPNFPRLVLQGTSMLDGKPVAVVSDRRVFEGDSIEGATVIRIEERSVELEFQGRRFTLSL